MEYFDHWIAHYCTGAEDIEGVLNINAGVLTFTAITNTAAVAGESSSKSSPVKPRQGSPEKAKINPAQG